MGLGKTGRDSFEDQLPEQVSPDLPDVPKWRGRRKGSYSGALLGPLLCQSFPLSILTLEEGFINFKENHLLVQYADFQGIVPVILIGRSGVGPRNLHCKSHSPPPQPQAIPSSFTLASDQDAGGPQIPF